jgi:putative endonuclease
MKVPCTYILASEPNGVLYVGVTSNLAHRIEQHEAGIIKGFTQRYGVDQLVYYEMHETMEQAIQREKRLKNWKRTWKIRLITSMNPEWIDLYDEETGAILEGPANIARNPRDFSTS